MENPDNFSQGSKLNRRQFLVTASAILLPSLTFAQDAPRKDVRASAIRTKEYPFYHSIATYFQVDDSVYDIRRETPQDGDGAGVMIRRAQEKYYPKIKIDESRLQKAILLFYHLNKKENDLEGIPFHVKAYRIMPDQKMKILKTDPNFLNGYNTPVLTHYKSLEEVIGRGRK